MPATIEVIEGQTVISVGENTATALAAATEATLAANAASAAGNYFPSKSSGEAATATGGFFSYPDGSGGLIYAERTAGGSVIIAEAATQAQIDTKVSSADLASTVIGQGGTLVGLDDGAGGSLWTHVRGFMAYLRSSVGSSVLGFIAAGAGAVARYIQDKLRERVSVKDFGAVGDGVTNDTAAINVAFAYTMTKAVKLYFPAGIYLYDGGGQLGNGSVLCGDGRNSSIIRARLAIPTSGTLIRALGVGSGLKGIRIDSAVTQTGGEYVWLSGPESFIEDFNIVGDKCGIRMSGNVSRIRHGRFHDAAPGAIRIKAEGGDNSQIIDDVLMGAQFPVVAFAGIRVRNSSALMITNTSVIQQGHNLLIDPFTNTTGSNTVDTDSGSVYSLYVNNCFFDNAGGDNVRIAPTGDASVVRIRFANSWMGSASGDGIYISKVGTGTVQGCYFDSCHAVLNGGSGLATVGSVGDIRWSKGLVAQNLFGFYVNNAIDGLHITDATIGAGGGLSGNTNAAVAFDAGAAASTNVSISGNKIGGNGSGFTGVSGLTAASVSIHDNLGAALRTFTPTISFATPGDLAVTYSANSGQLVKAGNRVIASFVISTSAFTHTTAAGQFEISGLPYALTGFVANGLLEWQGITKAGYTQINLAMSTGSNKMVLRATGSGQPISAVNAGDIPSGSNVTLRGTIEYFA